MTPPPKKNRIAGKAKKTSKQAPKRKTASEKTAARPAALKATLTGTGIKKRYFKTKDVCKVTFRLPRAAALNARSVSVVGDFNDWNIHANPLKRLKSRDYKTSLELARDGQYQFRYLVDGIRWENDWQADRYVKNPYGDSDNSVIIV